MPDIMQDQDNISRFCRKKYLNEDGHPTAAAFMLREKVPPRNIPETSLSVNWLEKINSSDLAEAIEGAKVKYREKFTGSCNGKVAILNVGTTIDYVDIFFPSSTERQSLLKGVFLNFNNMIQNEHVINNNSFDMSLAYGVDVKFVGELWEVVGEVFPSA